MRFEELRIRGFLSFSGQEQVVKLGQRGLVLIEGENLDDPTVANNGSGKSSISDALLWCLYGKTIRGVSGDEVVNRRTKTGCKVSVVFTNDKGETFYVHRYRKDPKEKNRLAFVGPKGGLTANETSRTEARIVDTLGMDFNTFTSAVVFGQGAFKSFANLSDKEAKALLDRLVGIEVVSEAHKTAKKERDELQAKIDATVFPPVKEVRQRLVDARGDRDVWARTHEEKASDLRRLLGGAVPSVKEHEAETKAAESRWKSERTRWNELNEVFLHAQKRVSEAHLVLGQAKTAVRRVEAGVTKCEVCGRDGAHPTAKAHYAKLKLELAGTEKAWAACKADSDRTASRLFDSMKKRDHLEAKWKTAASLLSQVSREAERRAGAQTRLDDHLAEKNPHTKAVKRAKVALGEAKREKAKLEAGLVTLRTQLKTHDFVTSMLSDKGSDGRPPLKALIMDAVAPFLNRKLAHYSKFLTDGNIRIEFDTQSTLKSGELRDSYSLKVTNAHGSEAYEGSSGGERRKVDVAVFFALQALAANRSKERVRLLVADEVFDALDETATETLMELLLHEKKDKDTILVISQRPELRSYFPTSLKVRKSKGLSTIVSSC